MKKSIWLAGFVCVLLVAALAFSVFADTTPTVYLDGSAADGGDGTLSAPVNTLEKAAALLPNGGKIVLTGDVTVSSRYYAFPSASGKLTVTSEGYGKQIKFSYSDTTFLQFISEVEFEHISINRTSSNYMEITSGPSLTFGENVVLLCKGNIVGAGTNKLMVRLGYNEYSANTGVSYPKTCENASFTMLSGTVNYVQGGNKWTPVTGTSTITLGEDAVLTDFLQAGGTANGSRNVGVNNVVINADGASVPAVHLGAYSTAKINGNVTATFKNMPNMTIQDQRTNASTDGNIVGNLSLTLINSPATSLTVNKRPIGGNLSVTLDNSDVETITGLDSTGIGGTVSMTLKNFEEYYPATDFAGVDALTVTDSVVCVGSTYAGPSTITADADSILKLGGTTNTQTNVPAVTGGGNAVLVAPGSSIPGDPISMKYDDRIDVSRSMLVEIIDAGTPTSDKVGYGVAAGTKDDAVITYDTTKKQLIASGIGTAKVAIDGISHEITVEKAKISMFLLIGQSNMAGSDGNKNQSIICPDGQVYSTFGAQSSNYGSSGLPGLTQSNGASFVASALAGSGALTARDGSADNMTIYPIGAFTEDGPGKTGMDSGIGYELNKLTGEKVWLINAAQGATRIAQWVPTGSEYKQAVGLFKQAQETMKAEIAAGHYELTYMGYFWCQGCADRIQTTEYYLNMFDSMHQQLKTDLAFDFNGDGDKADAHEVLESANMVLVRACGTDGYSSQYDVKTKEYFDYRDLQMNGVRTAQYYMANSTEAKFADVHMVSNLGDSFVYWDLEHTQDDVAEIFRSRYPDGIDYKIQNGAAVSMPQNQHAVHATIHYTQIGFNEVGREAARNFYYRINPDKQPDEAVSIKLYAWDGVTDLAGKNETKILTEGETVVPVVYPLYKSKSLTVSGLDYDFYELNGTRGGTVTASVGSVSVSYNLTPDPYNNIYRWETVDGVFQSVTGTGLTENDLTLLTGTNADGALTNAGFRLENPLVLLHDVPWAIEWQGAVKSSASNSTAFMLLASSASSNTLNAPYMFVSSHGIILGERNDAMGDDKNAFNHREAYATIDLNDGEAVYQLVNEITATGNMVYLYIDGQKIGAVDNGGKDSWVNGQDFVFSHIGARSTAGMTTTTDAKAEAYNHTLTGTMDHLQVWENRMVKVAANGASCTENGNKEHYKDLATGKTYSDANGTVEMADVTIQASHDMTHHAADPASCTEDGTVEYWSCSVCNKNFADEAGTTELTTIVDESDGHDMTHFPADPSDCTTDGNVEYWHCGTCGKNFADKDGETELTTIVDTKDGHNMTHFEAKPSDCTTDGNVEYWHCGACGKNFADKDGVTELDSIVDTKDGHSMTHFEAKPSDCTTDGNVEYWHCGTCNKNFADKDGVTELDSTVDTKDGHDLRHFAADPSDCTMPGNIECWHCVACGKNFADAEGTVELPSTLDPADGHTMTHHDPVAPDCTKNGNVEYWSCSVCNKNFADKDGARELPTIIDPMLDHEMTHYAADPSNCTEDGTLEYWHCGTCNKNYADKYGFTELDSTVDTKDGHNMTHFEAKPSDCTTDGNVEYWHCGTCDKNFADEAGVTELDSTVDTKDGHDMTHFEAKPSDCTTDGNIEYWHCGTCNKNFADEAGVTELTTTVDTKDGHSFTNYVSDGNATCEADGTKTATCDREDCDEKDTVADVGSKLPHELTEVKEEAATADKTGTKAHWVCDTCDKLFSDAEGKNEVKASDLVIPALGHEVEKETVTGAIIEGLANAVHGESYTFTVKLEEGYIKGENFKVMVNGKELKANADGSYTIVSVTGKLEISVSGAVKASTIPDTGDNTPIVPVLLVMALSALCFTVVYGKKHRFIP